MIGMIEPLVKGPRYLGRTAKAVMAYTAGVLPSAVLVGAAVGVIGLGVQRLAWVQFDALVVAAGCAVLAWVDLGVRGARPPGLRRQTCKVWPRTLGPLAAWLCWGLDLGLGFSTYRATSLFWAVVLTAVFAVRPGTAPLVLAAYGLGLVVNLCLGAATLRHTRLFDEAGSPTVLLLRPVRRASGLVLLVWSATMVWVALS